MIRHRKIAWLYLGTGAALWLSACSTPPPTSPVGSPAPATAPPGQAVPTSAAGGRANAPAAAGRAGGSVTDAEFADIKTVNPILYTDSPSGRIVHKLYEPLVQVDPKTGEPVPWLAENWTISSDGLKYTFKLRPGITWSNGAPLTARDVKATWEAALDPKTESVRKSDLEPIAGAKERIAGAAAETSGLKVVDDQTIEVTLSAPNCAFLTNGGNFDIVPAQVLTGQDLSQSPINTAPQVSLGPWLFKEWVKGSHVTLVRNDKYWGGPDGSAKGGAKLDRFIYKVVPDQVAVLNNLRTGEADLGELQPKDRDEASRLPNLDVKSWTGLRYSYIGFNLRRPILQDKALRKALALGLDTKTLIDKILNGEGKPLASHMPPNSWAYNPNVAPVAFDPVAARKLLDDAGWQPGPDGIRSKGGQRLKLTLWTNSGNKVREAVATIAQQQWKDIGVELDLQFVDFSALLDRVQKTFDFDLVLLGWALDPEPDPTGIWHSKSIPAAGKAGSNYTGYSNPEVDRLIEAGLTVPGCAKDERKKVYGRFQEILADDQPYIWLFLQNTIEGYSRRIQGVDPGPFRVSAPEAWNAEHWTVTN